MRWMQFLVIGLLSFSLLSCRDSKKELWIYTSLYKDTIADIQPKLEKQFPDIAFNFFQAGSEEIASKINAEMLAGGTKADVIIFSDRFWYEDMAQQGKFVKYTPKGSETVPDTLKDPNGYYVNASIPLMVLIYNTDAVPEKTAPKTFKEMADPKWKGKFSTGSPLSSGTNFTTVAFLQKAYGWDYFKALRKNDTISEGGNSAVIRRVQTKERPIGWVLLENALRFQDTDPKMKIVYPEDGAIINSNVMAIVKKDGSPEAAEKFTDWIYTKEGQDAMTRSYMYSPLPGYEPPKGAVPLDKVLEKAPKWTPEFLAEIMKSRESIKEEFTKIMFQ
jgi:iron(III) transport system substrate-binding protein